MCDEKICSKRIKKGISRNNSPASSESLSKVPMIKRDNCVNAKIYRTDIRFVENEKSNLFQDHNEGTKFTRFHYAKPCLTLARELLGKVLARKLPSGEILRGEIVETESYLGSIDKASHSFNGKRTERNAAMFMDPGTSYVYSIYGTNFCFNISSLEEGSAVLIRSLEPLSGFSDMHIFRSSRRKVDSQPVKFRELCNGPSKLCQALNITKDLNKDDLVFSDVLWVEGTKTISDSDIIACKRIGISSAGEEWANKPLRFYIKGNSFVSIRNKAAELNRT